jgi:flagellar basal-body rod protein FlgF
MDNTLLVSLSHQLAAYRAMDVIANNVANVSTPAFKREEMKFEEYISNMRPAEGEVGVRPISFVVDRGIVRDLGEGRIEQTGAPFDFAIKGKGYFVVQTPAGERYTRDGHFTLNPDGNLTTLDGNPVLGDGGPVTIAPEDGDITVGSDGTITGKQGQLGKLRLSDFADERALRKEGANLYASNQPALTAENASIEQGVIEASNVNPVAEITQMIEVSRAYQMSTTLTQSHQSMLQQAVQKLGAMPGN